MKIVENGLLKNGTRVNLIGVCDFCKCKFSTFVDVFRDVPGKGDILFRADQDCVNMHIKPEWVYDGETTWLGYVVHSEHRVMRSVDYSVPCPECRNMVQLNIDPN